MERKQGVIEANERYADAYRLPPESVRNLRRGEQMAILKRAEISSSSSVEGHSDDGEKKMNDDTIIRRKRMIKIVYKITKCRKMKENNLED